MKKAQIIYPFLVLAIVGLLFVVIVLSLQKIGIEGNRPTPTSLNTENLKIVNVWMSEDGKNWWIDDSGPFDITDSQFEKPDRAIDIKVYKGMKSSMLFILRFSADRYAMNVFLNELTNFELNQVLMASPSDNTLKNLRSLEPRFFYAPTVKTLLKWSVYARLFIEQVYDPKADFIFIDKKIEKRLNERILNEIHRRKIPIVKPSYEIKI